MLINHVFSRQNEVYFEVKPLIRIISLMIFWGMFSSLTLSGCEPLALSSDELAKESPRFRADQIVEPEGDGKRVRVMAWNIKYGAMRAPFWFDCWGDQVVLSAKQVEQNMEELYGMIREADPDILMVEEIELHSRRSAYYDMVQGILDHTDLNYGAYYETWHSRYIPSEGLGRMSLGNAIFSKYPITKSTKIAQDDREDLDSVTRIFYIHRSIGRAEIMLPDDVQVAAYVVHTEAYDEDGTKARQINQIYDVVSTEALPFVLGGDFNELPPTAAQIQNFPDERSTAVCGDDFDQPPYTPDVMSPFYVGLHPWIESDRYGSTELEQSRYYTHSVLGSEEVNERGKTGRWNRTLDYLFASASTQWVTGTTDVLQHTDQQVGLPDAEGVYPLNWSLDADPMSLSDHAPVFGVWEVAP